MRELDVVNFILERDARLDPARLALKYVAMRKSPFAFFRATCALYFARLPKLGHLQDAPASWSCGDLHLENFGSYRAANGLVYFDLNDFDEALLAPCVFDVVRACASIALAGKTLDLSKSQQAQLMSGFIDSYAEALRHGHISWIERDTATGEIGKLVKGLTGTSCPKLLTKRTIASGKSRKIRVDGDRALEAPESEKARVIRLLEHWAQKNASPARIAEGYYDVEDVALRIAGLGSLGLERYVILVRGEGGLEGMRLLDLKRARASATLPAAKTRQPDWSSQAQRVFTVQTMMQAKSPANLATLVDRNRSYVLRELQPREDRLDLSQAASQPGSLAAAIASFGQLTAWAQLRSAGRRGSANADALMHFANKDKWPTRLVHIATKSATTTAQDWEVFAKAYDKGAFSLGSSRAQ